MRAWSRPITGRSAAYRVMPRTLSTESGRGRATPTIPVASAARTVIDSSSETRPTVAAVAKIVDNRQSTGQGRCTARVDVRANPAGPIVTYPARRRIATTPGTDDGFTIVDLG